MVKGYQRINKAVIQAVIFGSFLSTFRSVSAVSLQPPSISTLVKPQLWKRAMEEKDVVVSASLEKMQDLPTKKYSFYALMKVGSDVPQTRRVLTDYKIYAELIPYIYKVDFSAKDQILKIEGGIWKYLLRSQVQFTENSDRWIHYEIVGGHFAGLKGNIYFEAQGEKGTAIYFSGEQIGKIWPPQFVIERGAEVVFHFTANRLRSYIESQKKERKGALHGEKGKEIPQPRNHI